MANGKWEEHELIEVNVERDGLLNGIGKPEKLKYHPGYSRRIDEENRLVYCIDTNGFLHILSCKGHYKD